MILANIFGDDKSGRRGGDVMVCHRSVKLRSRASSHNATMTIYSGDRQITVRAYTMGIYLSKSHDGNLKELDG